MHRLKSSQREKAREFAIMTQTGEKTAQFCLQHHDWKLDLALDSYFANPEFYCKEPKASIDRKKLETLYSRYKGKTIIWYEFCNPERCSDFRTAKNEVGSVIQAQISLLKALANIKYFLGARAPQAQIRCGRIQVSFCHVYLMCYKCVFQPLQIHKNLIKYLWTELFVYSKTFSLIQAQSWFYSWLGNFKRPHNVNFPMTNS